MITEPLTTTDHLEIAGVVGSFVESTFTSERIRAACHSALGYDEVAWKQMVDMGWTALAGGADAVDEDFGPVVQCIVHRQLGAALAPSPLLGSVSFGSAALSALGGSEAASAMVDELQSGAVNAALVLGRGAGWASVGLNEVTARRTSSGHVVDGTADLVLDGGRADVLVIVAVDGDGDWGLYRVDGQADGLTREPVETVDLTRSLARVALESVDAEALHGESLSASRVNGLVDRLAVLLAAEMVGAATTAMELTLDYLRTRHQFGKPIGSFQALKHRCADMAVDLTVVQESLFAAANLMAAEKHEQLRVAAPLLLAQAAEVFRHVAEEAIQLHGGVGFTDELDVGLYYKRALVDTELLAPPADALARVDDVRMEESA